MSIGPYTRVREHGECRHPNAFRMNFNVWLSDWAVMVVAFEPSHQRITEWQQLIEQGIPLWIWNNSPLATDDPALDIAWHEFPKQRILGNLDQGGLGQALPLAWAALQSLGFRRALYLDQDAEWSIRTLEWIGAYWSKLGGQAMHYPWIQFRGNPLEYKSFLHQHEGGHWEGNPRLSEMHAGLGNFVLPTPARLVMTNGVFVDLPRAAALAGTFVPFRQDALDYQWCWEWFQHGIQVAWVSGCMDLHHPLWLPGRELVFWGFKWRFKDTPRERRQAFLRNIGTLALNAMAKGQWAWAWVLFRNLLSDRIYAVWFGILSSFCEVGPTRPGRQQTQGE